MIAKLNLHLHSTSAASSSHLLYQTKVIVRLTSRFPRCLNWLRKTHRSDEKVKTSAMISSDNHVAETEWSLPLTSTQMVIAVI